MRWTDACARRVHLLEGRQADPCRSEALCHFDALGVVTQAISVVTDEIAERALRTASNGVGVFVAPEGTVRTLRHNERWRNRGSLSIRPNKARSLRLPG